jgi:hypothetical protein
MSRIYAELIMPGHHPGRERQGEGPGEDKNGGSGTARAEKSGGRGKRGLGHDPVHAERLRCWRPRTREGAPVERSGMAVVGLEAV